MQTERVTILNESALYKVTYGLYVVSAEADGERSGCVVNTLQQVTALPVRLSVTVSKDNFTCGLIQKAGRFTASVLDQRSDLMSIGRFGFRTGKDFDKFQDISYARDNAGMPYPLEAACARYSCRVTDVLDLETHLMFVGVAEEAEILGEAEPLTYTYYRDVIKGLTPKNAPSYQKKD